MYLCNTQINQSKGTTIIPKMPFAFLMIAQRPNRLGLPHIRSGCGLLVTNVNVIKSIASVCALRMRLIHLLQETAESARACRTLAKSSPVA